MADIKGIVLEARGERAKVKINREESELSKVPKYLEAWNPISAKVGDTVILEYRSINKRKAQFILYGMPILSLLAGVAFGNSLSIFFHVDRTMPIILGSIVWLAVGLNYARIFKRDAIREGEQPVIYGIDAPKEIVIDLNDKVESKE